MKFELDELRNSMLSLAQLQGLTNLQILDEEFVFYYDETNNIRKLLLKEDKYFNIGIENVYKNFILGGLCLLKNEISNEKIVQLKKDLKLQPTIKEIKLAHIAKGNFLQCLNSKKLNVFLNWIVDNNIYLHYSSINIIFWSVVDIIDSCMEFDEGATQFNFDLKTILYEFVKQNLEEFVELFIEFQYPNLKKEQVNLFLNNLIQLIKQKKSKLEIYNINTQMKNFLIEMLIDILSKAENQDLIFIMNEKDNVLIENLFEFYLRPIYSFVNSKHFFDEEVNIREIFTKYTFVYKEKEIEYKFLNSKEDSFIQFSDVIIGFIGKIYEYLNRNSIKQIKIDLDNLNVNQKNNIKLLKEIIIQSDNKCKALIHSIEPLTEKQKFIFLLENIK